MFLKITSTVFVSEVEVKVDRLNSYAWDAFVWANFLFPLIMKCFPSMLLAVSTNSKACFIYAVAMDTHVDLEIWKLNSNGWRECSRLGRKGLNVKDKL